MRNIVRCVVAALLSGVVTVTTPLQAQSGSSTTGIVRLTVRAASGATPSSASASAMVGALVRVTSSSTTYESDDRGITIVPNIAAGPIWLHVRRIGYRPDSVSVSVVSGKTVDAELLLSPVAVALTPVTVFGRRTVQGPMAGFYHRQATGSGRFFTYAEILKRNPRRMTDLLRGIPGVRIDSRSQMNNVRIRGSRCSPLVWLDGQPLFATDIDLDALDPLSFDGIEVYSVASVPVEFLGTQRASSSCGTVLLWSRRGESRQSREPKRKAGTISPAARIAQLLDSLQVFSSSDVDVVARLDSTYIVHPSYPDSLYETQTSGRLLAEFIVNTSGTVIIETFSAITTTHVDFIEPVRSALRQQRFFPATRRGQPVQQIVQLPFNFMPDSTSRRRK